MPHKPLRYIADLEDSLSCEERAKFEYEMTVLNQDLERAQRDLQKMVSKEVIRENELHSLRRTNEQLQKEIWKLKEDISRIMKEKELK